MEIKTPWKSQSNPPPYILTPPRSRAGVTLVEKTVFRRLVGEEPDTDPDLPTRIAASRRRLTLTLAVADSPQ